MNDFSKALGNSFQLDYKKEVLIKSLVAGITENYRHFRHGSYYVEINGLNAVYFYTDKNSQQIKVEVACKRQINKTDPKDLTKSFAYTERDEMIKHIANSLASLGIFPTANVAACF